MITTTTRTTTAATTATTMEGANATTRTSATDTTTTSATPTTTCDVFTKPCIESCTITAAERQTVIWEQKLKSAQTPGDAPCCAIAEVCVNSCAAYGRVCPCAARIAAHAASKRVGELLDQSKVFTKPTNSFHDSTTDSSDDDFPYLKADDIIINEKLGVGGFSYVNACTLLNNKDKIDDNTDEKKKYAIKYLKKTSMVDLHQFKHGASDLAVEAFVLHRLRHPNIVKLYGVTAGSVENAFASGKECGYFLVIDRLLSTLEFRIDFWRRERENFEPGTLGRLFLSSDYKHKKKEQLMKCVKVAYDIANAMEYIHSFPLVYRDLKPDNVGFNQHNVVKLFDFGLTKELKDKDKTSDGQYRLTGNTGSRRYMSPEVALEKPYNQSVDVYSFGIMLWEMCTAEKPFQSYSAAKHQNQVVIGDERPKLDHYHTQCWPANLVWLIKNCWSKHPVARPNFTMVKLVLNDVMNERYQPPKSIVAPPSSSSSVPEPIPRSMDTKAISSSRATPEHNTITKASVGKDNTSSGSDEDPIAAGGESPRSSIMMDQYSPGVLSPLAKKSYFSSRAQSTPHVAVEAEPSHVVVPPPPPPAQFPKPLKKNPNGSTGNGRAKTWGFTIRKEDSRDFEV